MIIRYYLTSLLKGKFATKEVYFFPDRRSSLSIGLKSLQ
jgi:hypothetical protein